MGIYSTLQDLKEQYVEAALGEFAGDFDTDAIASEISVWHQTGNVARDGYIVASGMEDKFWDVVQRYEVG